MILFSNMCCTTICICDSNLKWRVKKKQNKFKSIEVEEEEEMSCIYKHIFFNISFQKTKCKLQNLNVHFWAWFHWKEDECHGNMIHLSIQTQKILRNKYKE